MPKGPSLKGMMRRPLWGPRESWMPMPGPLAMVVARVGRLVVGVTSAGWDHVSPSSSEERMRLR